MFTHEYEFYSIYNNPVLSEKRPKIKQKKCEILGKSVFEIVINRKTDSDNDFITTL